MKKNSILTFLAAGLAFFSIAGCSPTSHTVDGVNLNGTYTLSNIQVQGVDGSSITKVVTSKDTATFIHNVTINTTVFDDASPSCFEGSSWVLPHNGKGNYTINNINCGSGSRNIIWSIRTDSQTKQKYFQFKILDGRKAKNVTDGYILPISNITKSGFTLTSPVVVDGKNAAVVFNFYRN